MRLFFDIITDRVPSYDLRGRRFYSLEEASQLAELIALDLGSSEDEKWIGSEVKIRNVVGDTLVTIPICAAA